MRPPLLDNPWFRPIDVHAALLVEQLAGGNQPELLVCTALTSRAIADGHTCLPLAAMPAFLDESGRGHDLVKGSDKLQAILLATEVVGRPDKQTPLILDEHGNLYLQRYYVYEQQISEGLRSRAAQRPPLDFAQAQVLVKKLFPAKESGTEQDWQATAAIMALLRSLLVISGGPGTGKTYTVARILALLTSIEPDMHIALATPTGKAAARLQESIRLAVRTIPGELCTKVPDNAVTIHRLLSYRPEGRGFTYCRDNKLQLDLLVVDEASMVDVPLMAALLDALPPHCRLLLLGDRYQLAPVGAGNLFGDLCGSEQPAWSPQLCRELAPFTGWYQKPADDLQPLGDTVITLHHSYRFTRESGIGWLARKIKARAGGSLPLRATTQFPDLTWFRPDDNEHGPWLAEQIVRLFTPLFKAETAEGALAVLDCCRILCALREGPEGVLGINSRVETILHDQRLIEPANSGYRGQPIMVTRNHYGLQLFNGDTGILWPDRLGQLYAWFVRPDGNLHPVAPSRLPEHQTGYAITVHKAQGSEFGEVLLLLPSTDSPILTRELLYTGVTRAKKSLLLYAQEDIVNCALQRGATRYSGLRQKLARQYGRK